MKIEDWQSGAGGIALPSETHQREMTNALSLVSFVRSFLSSFGIPSFVILGNAASG
jgi:hypothetical protein